MRHGTSQLARPPRMAVSPEQAVSILEEDGIAAIPAPLSPEGLNRLTGEFRRALERPSFNTWRGYEQTEKWRLMVEDTLLLDEAAVDLALHPLICAAVRGYVGSSARLVEAKGWRTVPTMKDFHGWHGDSWFHPDLAATRPREIKLALYLTDVQQEQGGWFSYIAGTHRQPHTPRLWRAGDIEPLLGSQVDASGPAGSAFLFDTWGIHRQSAPVLSPREAVFYCYHDPSVALQDEDTAYGRYHPLMLNAGFLPRRPTADQADMLGLGGAVGLPAGLTVAGRHSGRHRLAGLHGAVTAALTARLQWAEVERQWRRVSGRLKRLMTG